MLVRLLQSWNAKPPMLVTLSGIVMLVRLVQSSNAEPPMLVTPSGSVMLVRLVQPRNAEYPILVKLLPKEAVLIFADQYELSSKS